MIVSQGRFCRVANVYFEEEPGAVAADIVHYIQRASPVPDSYYSVFCTIVLDLSTQPDALLAGMHKNTRNEIRQAFLTAPEFARRVSAIIAQGCLP